MQRNLLEKRKFAVKEKNHEHVMPTFTGLYTWVKLIPTLQFMVTQRREKQKYQEGREERRQVKILSLNTIRG